MCAEVLKNRKRRPYRHIERRYVVEYVANRFKRFVACFYNIRLGEPKEELKKRYPDIPERHFKVWLPTADAVVITDDFINLIEAKIRQPRAALGQLLDYAERIPKTPELKRYLDRGIKKILVIPLQDPEFERIALSYGIQIEYFTTPWVLEYLREVKLIP